MSIFNESDFENALKHLRERVDVDAQNKRDLIAFLEFKKLTGRGVHRRLRYLQNLTTLSKMLGKPFRTATQKDFEKLVAGIKDSSYAESTKSNFLIEVKAFKAWLSKSSKHQYPSEVAWIETGGDVRRDLDREQLLTQSDVDRLIDATYSPRLKALIALLYQTAARPSELLDCKVKDFFLENGVYALRINGTKTVNAVREVPVIDAKTIELVNAWLAVHPKKDSLEFKDSYLWEGKNGKQLSYFPLTNQVKRLFLEAGVTRPKGIGGYLFRHTRATLWANNPSITRSQLCYLMGWSQSSRVVDTYLHTNQKDVFKAFSVMQATSSDNTERQLEAIGKQMLERALRSDKTLVEMILASWKRTSPDLFARFISLAGGSVKLRNLRARGQGIKKKRSLTLKSRRR